MWSVVDMEIHKHTCNWSKTIITSNPTLVYNIIALGFQGEMDTHKRHTYLTRFYKTAVCNFLPITLQSSNQDEGTELLIHYNNVMV